VVLAALDLEAIHLESPARRESRRKEKRGTKTRYHHQTQKEDPRLMSNTYNSFQTLKKARRTTREKESQEYMLEVSPYESRDVNMLIEKLRAQLKEQRRSQMNPQKMESQKVKEKRRTSSFYRKSASGRVFTRIRIQIHQVCLFCMHSLILFMIC